MSDAQPLRAAGGQPPPLGLAGRRVPALLRVGGLRRGLRVLPADRRCSARRISPHPPLHRPPGHRGRLGPLLFRLEDRPPAGAAGGRGVGGRHPRLAGAAAAGERGRGDGRRGGTAEADRLGGARSGPQRLCHRARPAACEHRGHGGPPRGARPGRTAGRRGPRDGAHPERRREADDAAGGDVGGDRAPLRRPGPVPPARGPGRAVPRAAGAGVEGRGAIRWERCCSCSGCSPC